jgi:hypothetical protein
MAKPLVDPTLPFPSRLFQAATALAGPDQQDGSASRSRRGQLQGLRTPFRSQGRADQWRHQGRGLLNEARRQAVVQLGGLDAWSTTPRGSSCKISILDITTADFDKTYKTNAYAMLWISKGGDTAPEARIHDRQRRLGQRRLGQRLRARREPAAGRSRVIRPPGVRRGRRSGWTIAAPIKPRLQWPGFFSTYVDWRIATSPILVKTVSRRHAGRKA